jgi:hypothetical protein
VTAVFARACRLGLEGIVSKRRDLGYRSGRSAAWLKVRTPGLGPQGPIEPEVVRSARRFSAKSLYPTHKKEGRTRDDATQRGHSGPSTWTSSRCALVVCSAKVPLAWGYAG